MLMKERIGTFMCRSKMYNSTKFKKKLRFCTVNECYIYSSVHVQFSLSTFEIGMTL